MLTQLWVCHCLITCKRLRPNTGARPDLATELLTAQGKPVEPPLPQLARPLEGRLSRLAHRLHGLLSREEHGGVIDGEMASREPCDGTRRCGDGSRGLKENHAIVLPKAVVYVDQSAALLFEEPTDRFPAIHRVLREGRPGLGSRSEEHTSELQSR